MESPLLESRARKLVQGLADGCENGTLGSATVAIYDTAWVSMIIKHVDGRDQWLFPESFQFLLDNQLSDGSWESYASLDDGILNTLAALLALKRHSNAVISENNIDPFSLDVPISKAKSYLEEKLPDWDVDSGIHVGFEILVPALLAMLETEQMYFNFPDRHLLQKLRDTKLANFDPQTIYNDQTTLVHSLEAFVGEIDFDMLSRSKTIRSMMDSPASTAAYLMHSSQWDPEAEIYLRKVIDDGEGKGSGAVPSVFPTPVFETTWILSTLFQGDYSVDTLGADQIIRTVSYLQDHFRKQKGVLGFAPTVLPDADDTAKTILTLNHLGRKPDPEQMIKHFKTKQNHFCTYPGERNASFSANCNVLQALLSCHEAQKYTPEISSITAFLCDSWWTGTARDKWNHSLQYSMMVLSGALMRLLELCDQGVLKLSAALLQDQVPIVLTQLVNRTLLTQCNTGAWDANELLEATAYGVLTLSVVFTLPWIECLKEEIRIAIQKGQRFLTQAQGDWNKPQYLWIEKVTYGSPRLSEAYCLAAMRPSISSHTWSKQMSNIVDVTENSISKFSELISSLMSFKGEPRWKLKASAIEGYAFLPLLKSARMDILPRQKGARNKYLDFIPCTWVLINNHKGLFLQAKLLWDMMVLTMCNFRVDEYMEAAVAKFSEDGLEAVKSAIHSLCAQETLNGFQTKKRPHEDSARATNGDNGCSDLASFKAIMGYYISEMLNYPRIQHASLTDQNHLRSELQTFLLAHVAQIEDNARFSVQEPHPPSTTAILVSTRRSYYEWVHTVGANSISCPFSFAFFTCLLGSSLSSTLPPADCFSSIHQNYLVRDLCAHLAVMSRQYNDYGSFARDRAEANINSVNFAEFHGPYTHSYSKLNRQEDEQSKEIQLKADLLVLAQHERQIADSVGEKLLTNLRTSGSRKDRSKADSISLFMGVTALYADIYVARDLSNHVEKAQ